MHASDHELIAYLDGELATGERNRTRGHLDSCWHCRTRLASLEREIHRLTVAMDEWQYPDSAWMRESKSRLKLKILAADVEIANCRQARPVWVRRMSVFAAIAAGVVILAVSWLFLRQRGAAGINPEDTISRAIAVEAADYRRPVTQNFRLEIEELRPVQRKIGNELEIWADPISKRFSSRLRASNGKLVHGLWRSSAEKVHIYSASLSKTIRERPMQNAAPSLANLLSEQSLELGGIEAGFVQWLEGRTWDPISFAKGIEQWSSEDGIALRAEEIRVAGAPPLIRISAEKSTRQMVSVWSVSFDSKDYRPKLETIRFTTPERTVELRLTPRMIRPVSEEELSASIFEPEIPAVERTSSVPRPAPHPLQSDASPAFSPPPASESMRKAVLALYVLHRAGACVGEAVHIEEDGGIARIWNPTGQILRGFRSAVDLHSVLVCLPICGERLRFPAAPQRREFDRPLSDVLMDAWALKREAEDFSPSRTDGLPREFREMFAHGTRSYGKLA